MKNIFICFILLSNNIIFAQDHLFVASYLTKGEGCRDRLLAQKPVTNSTEYNELRKNFYKENNAISADLYLLKPNQAAVVYEFKTKVQGFTCEYAAHGVSYGKTIEEATNKMNESAQNTKVFLTSPKVVVSWDGKGVTKKIKQSVLKDYGGLQVEYIVTPLKKIFVKGKNTNKDLKTILKFIASDGKVIHEVEIEPDGSFNITIKEKNFEIEVDFWATSKNNNNILDKVKQYIKSKISIDNNDNIETSPINIGVRG